MQTKWALNLREKSNNLLLFANECVQVTQFPKRCREMSLHECNGCYRDYTKLTWIHSQLACTLQSIDLTGSVDWQGAAGELDDAMHWFDQSIPAITTFPLHQTARGKSSQVQANYISNQSTKLTSLIMRGKKKAQLFDYGGRGAQKVIQELQSIIIP